MTRKGFLALCMSAVVAVALAVVAILQQPRVRASDVAGDPLVPGLAQKFSVLKTVVVKGADGDLTLDLDGKSWVVRERNGYPADEQKIAAAVLQMVRMVKLEAKTAIPEKLDRLDLNDPKAKDSRAKEIVLLDRDGKTIADLIVGKQKFTLGGKDGGTYVRLAGSSQSWLALGELGFGDTPRDWMKRDLVDLKERDIRRVAVVHSDGEKIVVSKPGPQNLNYKIENLPAGKQPASEYAADEYGRVLTSLQADDVAKAEDVAFPKDKTTTADIETFNGLHVTLQATEKDGKSWIRIKADAPAVAKPEEGTPPSANPAQLAADINARVDGWAFAIAPYQTSTLRKHMADFLKKPETKS